MDLTGIGEAADAAKGIIGMFFPDKTEEDKAKLAGALALINAQTDIDKTEAASTDPLQHWRGGLGWVCVAAYAWNFVVQPLTITISGSFGQHVSVVPLDIGPLVTLTGGMLGLGGLHVAERIKGVS